MTTVELALADPGARAIWQDALELMGHLKGDWTLIGGLMVQLHAERYESVGARATNDTDILANSRARPSATEQISVTLTQLGFQLLPPVGIDHGTAYRFERGEEIVDVLGPDGVGANPPRTVGNLETIQVSGGTQALRRTEAITVGLEGKETEIRCPSLLGAILLKSRSVTKKDREQDREDLIRLLTCVQEPRSLKAELKAGERRWLQSAEARLDLGDPGLANLFGSEQLRLARATYRLLIERP